MGVLIDEPKFPVIDPAPGIYTSFSNLRFSDVQIIAGATFGSYVYGYISGKGVARMGPPTAAVAASIGLLSGLTLAYQNASGRLMGLCENGPEVQQYAPVKRPFE
mmetsp:Transcript_36286/g.50399  ORF Transcript_36286/g.50399 Transcript_36286/m.50399 type:complete len:105 (-) Transcript_36286:102-416(-)|eukprot:CAMPEP_0196573392 /NCGR_PEP_ID=MMETSP1081-20130531/3300_1 /TAXON_ID=36882 /ORGANISM="Pyramimonas amylifera, Strain CCMP720" /LENGTH=104 /DNA_ID=CAMNT_0041891075 /DNA_START=90 /DNA_END=404 /DNA_ORIENTATION=-